MTRKPGGKLLQAKVERPFRIKRNKKKNPKKSLPTWAKINKEMP
jgi:hypothetical protein